MGEAVSTKPSKVTSPAGLVEDFVLVLVFIGLFSLVRHDPTLGKAGLLALSIILIIAFRPVPMVLMWAPFGSACLGLWALAGPGTAGAAIKLAANSFLFPAGIAAVFALGPTRAVSVLLPAAAMAVLVTAGFTTTHEAVRLSNPFPLLAAATLALVSGSWWRWPLLLALGMTQTRIAVAAAIAVWLGLRPWRRASDLLFVFSGLAATGVIAAITAPRLFYVHDSGRLAYWQLFWDGWLRADEQTRLWGFGAGTVSEVLSRLEVEDRFGEMHNEFLHLLIDVGWGGMVIWACAFTAAVLPFKPGGRAIWVAATMLIPMATDNVLGYGDYQFLMGAAVAVALPLHREQWPG